MSKTIPLNYDSDSEDTEYLNYQYDSDLEDPEYLDQYYRNLQGTKPPNNQYYDDSKDPECLNKQYYLDAKNFEKLPEEFQRLHIRKTIEKYGIETLEGKKLAAAKDFGLDTEHSSTDNSWLATAADVIAIISKGVLFFAGVGAVFKIVGAHPITYNTLGNSSADNSDPNNSDTVHHRSVRAIIPEQYDTTEIWGLTPLQNKRCSGAIVKKFLIRGKGQIELYGACWEKSCDTQPTVESSYNFKWLAGTSSNHFNPPEMWIAKGTIKPESATIRYSFAGPSGSFIESSEITCHEPAYPIVQEGNRLLAEGRYIEAQEKFNEALEIRANYSLALEGNDKVLEELAKITTIEPSSNTLTASILTANTLAAKDSTSTENSTLAQDNTSSSHIPTAAPHEQNAKAHGWSAEDIYKIAGSAVGFAALGGGVIAFFYKKGKNICETVLGYFSKSEESSDQKHQCKEDVLGKLIIDDMNCIGDVLLVSLNDTVDTELLARIEENSEG